MNNKKKLLLVKTRAMQELIRDFIKACNLMSQSLLGMNLRVFFIAKCKVHNRKVLYCIAKNMKSLTRKKPRNILIKNRCDKL